MIRKMLSTLINPTTQEDKRAELYREIIRNEAKVGGKLFGPVATGGRREFFCLNESTWVWHEEWTDHNGQRQTMTTRYDVRPNGVLKAQNNQTYQYVTLEEAKRLYHAVSVYNQRVDAELYGLAA